jgi:hypothetical protein
MTADPKSILSEINEICAGLIRSVTALDSEETAYSVECSVFKSLLAVGRLVMIAFFAAQATRYTDATVTVTVPEKDAVVLKRNGSRDAVFYSIFGDLPIRRAYYCGEGRGWFPMDAALNLPMTGLSDFLRKLKERLGLRMSYVEANDVVAEYFPVSRSTRALKEAIETDSQDAEAYYSQLSAPDLPAEATILVCEADNKGVNMVKPANLVQADVEPGRPKAGPTHDGKKKDATVVSVSVHIPLPRTPEEVLASLFEEDEVNDPAKQAERIREKSCMVKKYVYATMHGKKKGLDQAVVWIEKLDGPQIMHRVVLTDGAKSLQQVVDDALCKYEFIRILDLLHACGYVWKAADAQFGAKTPEWFVWAKGAILRLLKGLVGEVIDEIDEWSNATNEQSKIKILETCAGYFERNQEEMRYNEYLAAGYPIATGIIEGACRHIVKDRCEGSGMRWSVDGAEGILHLNCIHHNGDWDAYHDFRMDQRHRTQYGECPKNDGPIRIQESDVHKFKGRITYSQAV